MREKKSYPLLACSCRSNEASLVQGIQHTAIYIFTLPELVVLDITDSCLSTIVQIEVNKFLLMDRRCQCAESKLLRVMRECVLAVCCNLRGAVGFGAVIIGGASVMRITGCATLCSSAVASTFCSAGGGGGTYSCRWM